MAEQEVNIVVKLQAEAENVEQAFKTIKQDAEVASDTIKKSLSGISEDGADGQFKGIFTDQISSVDSTISRLGELVGELTSLTTGLVGNETANESIISQCSSLISKCQQQQKISNGQMSDLIATQKFLSSHNGVKAIQNAGTIGQNVPEIREAVRQGAITSRYDFASGRRGRNLDDAVGNVPDSLVKSLKGIGISEAGTSSIYSSLSKTIDSTLRPNGDRLSYLEGRYGRDLVYNFTKPGGILDVKGFSNHKSLLPNAFASIYNENIKRLNGSERKGILSETEMSNMILGEIKKSPMYDASTGNIQESAYAKIIDILRKTKPGVTAGISSGIFSLKDSGLQVSESLTSKKLANALASLYSSTDVYALGKPGDPLYKKIIAELQSNLGDLRTVNPIEALYYKPEYDTYEGKKLQQEIDVKTRNRVATGLSYRSIKSASDILDILSSDSIEEQEIPKTVSLPKSTKNQYFLRKDILSPSFRERMASSNGGESSSYSSLEDSIFISALKKARPDLQLSKNQDISNIARSISLGERFDTRDEKQIELIRQIYNSDDGFTYLPVHGTGANAEIRGIETNVINDVNDYMARRISKSINARLKGESFSPKQGVKLSGTFIQGYTDDVIKSRLEEAQASEDKARIAEAVKEFSSLSDASHKIFTPGTDLGITIPNGADIAVVDTEKLKERMPNTNIDAIFNGLGFLSSRYMQGAHQARLGTGFKGSLLEMPDTSVRDFLFGQGLLDEDGKFMVPGLNGKDFNLADPRYVGFLDSSMVKNRSFIYGLTTSRGKKYTKEEIDEMDPRVFNSIVSGMIQGTGIFSVKDYNQISSSARGLGSQSMRELSIFERDPSGKINVNDEDFLAFSRYEQLGLSLLRQALQDPETAINLLYTDEVNSKEADLLKGMTGDEKAIALSTKTGIQKRVLDAYSAIAGKVRSGAYIDFNEILEKDFLNDDENPLIQEFKKNRFATREHGSSVRKMAYTQNPLTAIASLYSASKGTSTDGIAEKWYDSLDSTLATSGKKSLEERGIKKQDILDAFNLKQGQALATGANAEEIADIRSPALFGEGLDLRNLGPTFLKFLKIGIKEGGIGDNFDQAQSWKSQAERIVGGLFDNQIALSSEDLISTGADLDGDMGHVLTGYIAKLAKKSIKKRQKEFKKNGINPEEIRKKARDKVDVQDTKIKDVTDTSEMLTGLAKRASLATIGMGFTSGLMDAERNSGDIFTAEGMETGLEVGELYDLATTYLKRPKDIFTYAYKNPTLAKLAKSMRDSGRFDDPEKIAPLFISRDEYDDLSFEESSNSPEFFNYDNRIGINLGALRRLDLERIGFRSKNSGPALASLAAITSDYYSRSTDDDVFMAKQEDEQKALLAAQREIIKSDLHSDESGKSFKDFVISRDPKDRLRSALLTRNGASLLSSLNELKAEQSLGRLGVISTELTDLISDVGSEGSLAHTVIGEKENVIKKAIATFFSPSTNGNEYYDTYKLLGDGEHPYSIGSLRKRLESEFELINGLRLSDQLMQEGVTETNLREYIDDEHPLFGLSLEQEERRKENQSALIERLRRSIKSQSLDTKPVDSSSVSEKRDETSSVIDSDPELVNYLEEMINAQEGTSKQKTSSKKKQSGSKTRKKINPKTQDVEVTPLQNPEENIQAITSEPVSSSVLNSSLLDNVLANIRKNGFEENRSVGLHWSGLTDFSKFLYTPRSQSGYTKALRQREANYVASLINSANGLGLNITEETAGDAAKAGLAIHKAFENDSNIPTKFKKKLGETLLGREINLWGLFGYGQDESASISGTADMISLTEDGKIVIGDLKPSGGIDYSGNPKEQYAQQVSLYGEMLRQRIEDNSFYQQSVDWRKNGKKTMSPEQRANDAGFTFNQEYDGTDGKNLRIIRPEDVTSGRIITYAEKEGKNVVRFPGEKGVSTDRGSFSLSQYNDETLGTVRQSIGNVVEMVKAFSKLFSTTSLGTPQEIFSNILGSTKLSDLRGKISNGGIGSSLTEKDVLDLLGYTLNEDGSISVHQESARKTRKNNPSGGGGNPPNGGGNPPNGGGNPPNGGGNPPNGGGNPPLDDEVNLDILRDRISSLYKQYEDQQIEKYKYQKGMDLGYAENNILRIARSRRKTINDAEILMNDPMLQGEGSKQIRGRLAQISGTSKSNFGETSVKFMEDQERRLEEKIPMLTESEEEKTLRQRSKAMSEILQPYNYEIRNATSSIKAIDDILQIDDGTMIGEDGNVLFPELKESLTDQSKKELTDEKGFFNDKLSEIKDARQRMIDSIKKSIDDPIDSLLKEIESAQSLVGSDSKSKSSFAESSFKKLMAAKKKYEQDSLLEYDKIDENGNIILGQRERFKTDEERTARISEIDSLAQRNFSSYEEQTLAQLQQNSSRLQGETQNQRTESIISSIDKERISLEAKRKNIEEMYKLNYGEDAYVDKLKSSASYQQTEKDLEYLMAQRGNIPVYSSGYANRLINDFTTQYNNQTDLLRENFLNNAQNRRAQGLMRLYGYGSVAGRSIQTYMAYENDRKRLERSKEVENKEIANLDNQINKLEEKQKEGSLSPEDSIRYNSLTAERKARETRVSEYQNEINSINPAMESLLASTSQVFMKIQNVITGYLRRAFNIGIQEAKKFIKEFNASMTEIQMITLKDDSEMSTVKEETIAQAYGLHTSISNVANTKAALYRQGLGDDEVNSRLDSIIQFSEVAKIKVTDATKIITVALQNGLVDTAQEASDAFVALGDNAATTASEIAKAYQKVAATASINGFGNDELMALITFGISDTQLSGQQIGTGLNTILQRMNKISTNSFLSDPSGAGGMSASDAKKALKAIGIDVEGKSDFDLLKELGLKWKYLNDYQQNAMAQIFGSTRGANVFSTIMNGISEDDGETLDKYLGLANGSEGITQSKYEIAIQSLNTAITDLKTAFDDLISDEEFMGSIVDLINRLAQGIKNLTDETNPLGNAIRKLLETLVKLAPLIVGFSAGSKIGSGIGATVGSILSLIPGVNVTAPAATVVGTLAGGTFGTLFAKSLTPDYDEKTLAKKQDQYGLDSIEKNSNILSKLQELNSLNGDNLTTALENFKTMFPELATIINANEDSVQNLINAYENLIKKQNEEAAKKITENAQQDLFNLAGENYGNYFNEGDSKIYTPEMTFYRDFYGTKIGDGDAKIPKYSLNPYGFNEMTQDQKENFAGKVLENLDTSDLSISSILNGATPVSFIIDYISKDFEIDDPIIKNLLDSAITSAVSEIVYNITNDDGSIKQIYSQDALKSYLRLIFSNAAKENHDEYDISEIDSYIESVINNPEKYEEAQELMRNDSDVQGGYKYNESAMFENFTYNNENKTKYNDLFFNENNESTEETSNMPSTGIIGGSKRNTIDENVINLINSNKGISIKYIYEKANNQETADDVIDMTDTAGITYSSARDALSELFKPNSWMGKMIDINTDDETIKKIIEAYNNGSEDYAKALAMQYVIESADDEAWGEMVSQKDFTTEAAKAANVPVPKIISRDQEAKDEIGRYAEQKKQESLLTSRQYGYYQDYEKKYNENKTEYAEEIIKLQKEIDTFNSLKNIVSKNSITKTSEIDSSQARNIGNFLKIDNIYEYDIEELRGFFNDKEKEIDDKIAAINAIDENTEIKKDKTENIFANIKNTHIINEKQGYRDISESTDIIFSDNKNENVSSVVESDSLLRLLAMKDKKYSSTLAKEYSNNKANGITDPYTLYSEIISSILGNEWQDFDFDEINLGNLSVLDEKILKSIFSILPNGSIYSNAIDKEISGEGYDKEQYKKDASQEKISYYSDNWKGNRYNELITSGINTLNGTTDIIDTNLFYDSFMSQAANYQKMEKALEEGDAYTLANLLGMSSTNVYEKMQTEKGKEDLQNIIEKYKEDLNNAISQMLEEYAKNIKEINVEEIDFKNVQSAISYLGDTLDKSILNIIENLIKIIEGVENLDVQSVQAEIENEAKKMLKNQKNKTFLERAYKNFDRIRSENTESLFDGDYLIVDDFKNNLLKELGVDDVSSALSGAALLAFNSFGTDGYDDFSADNFKDLLSFLITGNYKDSQLMYGFINDVFSLDPNEAYQKYINEMDGTGLQSLLWQMLIESNEDLANLFNRSNGTINKTAFNKIKGDYVIEEYDRYNQGGQSNVGRDLISNVFSGDYSAINESKQKIVDASVENDLIERYLSGKSLTKAEYEELASIAKLSKNQSKDKETIKKNLESGRYDEVLKNKMYDNYDIATTTNNAIMAILESTNLSNFEFDDTRNITIDSILEKAKGNNNLTQEQLMLVDLLRTLYVNNENEIGISDNGQSFSYDETTGMLKRNDISVMQFASSVQPLYKAGLNFLGSEQSNNFDNFDIENYSAFARPEAEDIYTPLQKMQEAKDTGDIEEYSNAYNEAAQAITDYMQAVNAASDKMVETYPELQTTTEAIDDQGKAYSETAQSANDFSKESKKVLTTSDSTGKALEEATDEIESDASAIENIDTTTTVDIRTDANIETLNTDGVQEQLDSATANLSGYSAVATPTIYIETQVDTGNVGTDQLSGFASHLGQLDSWMNNENGKTASLTLSTQTVTDGSNTTLTATLSKSGSIQPANGPTMGLSSGGLGGPKSSGGGGGGGGGSSKNKILKKWERLDAAYNHRKTMYNSTIDYYDSTGDLENKGEAMEQYNELLLERQENLAKKEKEILKEMDKKKVNSKAWLELRAELYKTQEEYNNLNKEIYENNKAIRENKKEILNRINELKQSAADTFEAIIDSEYEKLSAKTDMEDTILEAIKNRYNEEWELMQEDLNKKQKALQEEIALIDERLKRRKQASDEAKKYEELDELRVQLSMIELDQTRTKEARSLREKIANLEEEIGWTTAENEAEYQKNLLESQENSLNEFAEEYEKDLEKYLENANNFADEISAVLKLSQEELLSWLANNVKEYSNSISDVQETMKKEWTDTFKTMMGIVTTYWDLVDSSVKSKEDYIKLMAENSQEYAAASEEERRVMLMDWEDQYDQAHKASSAADLNAGTEYVTNWNGTKTYDAYTKTDSGILSKKGTFNVSRGTKFEVVGDGTENLKLSKKGESASYLLVRYEVDGQEVERYIKASDLEDLGTLDTLTTFDNYISDEDFERILEEISKNLLYKLENGSIPGYSNGGVVDYTGLAMVHGTKENPEYMLNAEETKLMKDFINNHNLMSYNCVMQNIPDDFFYGNSVVVGDINVSINNPVLNSDDDYENIANKIGESFMQTISSVGINIANYSI